ncbi:cytochrome P450 monooxygenase pc-1 [Coprinopsis sp. MPI-PUGE-AT-0042]|nr:cytochrome P450 monooxygenase pc-1 [Coprinopsis sp. MPI-PUGE-AT-0042]
MTWGVTPGAEFLARYVAAPTALHYGLLTVASRLVASNVPGFPGIPSWAILALSFLVIPTRIFARIAYSRWNDQREAEKRGARLAPALVGKQFGNRDQLKYLLDCWKYGYICDGLREMTEDLGPAFSPDLLFGNIVFTVWPEHVKIILSTDFNNYVKGERFQFAMSSVLGSGVFNSDGEIWKFHRSMTRPFFSRERVTDLDRFERHTQTALSLLVEKAKTGYAMDIQDVVQRLALDVSTDILFGSCANTLEVSAKDLALPYNHPQYSVASSKAANRATAFSDAFLNAQFVIANRERLGHVWPLFEIFEDKAKPHMEIVNRFVDPIIQEALRKNAANPKGAESNEIEADETLLDHLVRSTSDHKLLRDETLNILLAGRDTSSAVLTFTAYFLAMHPEVMKKLREEILTQVGPSRAPTYDDVRAMKYLRAVLNESMRLLPPVPNDVRECVNGAIWPSPDPDEKPIYIPPGSSTPYSPILIHTRKDLWGPDADEFDPDRFIDDRVKKYLVPNPYIFIPFNAGPRICLGQQFAYNLMSFVLVRLLQQFSSFSLDEEALTPELRVPKEWAETGKNSRKAKERFRPHTVLTMSSKGGIWLKAALADA